MQKRTFAGADRTPNTPGYGVAEVASKANEVLGPRYRTSAKGTEVQLNLRPIVVEPDAEWATVWEVTG
jgi:hypothetical protein